MVFKISKVLASPLSTESENHLVGWQSIISPSIERDNTRSGSEKPKQTSVDSEMLYDRNMKPYAPETMDIVTFHLRLLNAIPTLWLQICSSKKYKQTIYWEYRRLKAIKSWSAKLLFTVLLTTMQRYQIKWAYYLAQQNSIFPLELAHNKIKCIK